MGTTTNQKKKENREKKNETDRNMKLSAGILLASGATAFDAHIENFEIVKTRTSRLYVQWDVVGADKDQVTDYDVLVYDQSLSRTFEKIRMHEPAHGYREIHGLK